MIAGANDVNCARVIVKQGASAESACRPAVPIYMRGPLGQETKKNFCTQLIDKVHHSEHHCARHRSTQSPFYRLSESLCNH